MEYDKDVMTKPGFDLILGSNTMKELGIVLDFQTKVITLDEISLPMRDITKLSRRAQIEKSWSLNNSIFQENISSQLSCHTQTDAVHNCAHYCWAKNRQEQCFVCVVVPCCVVSFAAICHISATTQSCGDLHILACC